jgi:hypothetical protein
MKARNIDVIATIRTRSDVVHSAGNPLLYIGFQNVVLE